MKKLLILLICLLLGACASIPADNVPETDSNQETGPGQEVEPADETESDTAVRFEIGDKLIYSESEWYVIALHDDCCTLVSAVHDYSDSIYFDYDLLFGMIRHFTDRKLTYEESAMKLYLEEEVAPAMNELAEVDGYKIRLLTLKDIENIVPLEKRTDDNGLDYYVQTDDRDYSWLIENNSWCWTMEECTDDLPDIVYGETKSQQYQHFSWYTLTNYGHIEVTGVGTRRDDSIKIVINIRYEYLDKISQ